jgi:hypothetical protein
MMEKLIVKAVGAKGHWAFGRFWPHEQATELELVHEPAEERAAHEDSHDAQQKKYALRCARIASGKVTAQEAERIRGYQHLVEVKVEKCARCAELEAQVAELTAPKKGSK